MLILSIIIAIILALIPVIIWGYLFYIKEPEPKRLILKVFLGGMISIIPIILYKASWQYYPNLNVFLYVDNFKHHFIGIGDIFSIPVSVIFTFMFVGVVEEYMKHFIVKFTDKNNLKNIDDVMELSIIAALGFAFVENILYFLLIWQKQGVQNLIIAFIFRSIFSTFAHILFSGIYGYFYGIARFASPIYKENLIKNRSRFTTLMHKIIHLKGETIFKEEKIVEGLMFSMLLHALFNIVLELDFTILVVPFLIIGYIYLSYLFSKKEDHKEYGRVVGEQ